MKQSFIKFTLRFSLLAVCMAIPSVAAWSCGPILSHDESRFALFRQGLDGSSGQSPFNYGELPFYYVGADPDQLDYQRNCNEWKSFIGNSISTTDIYEVQYKIPADRFLALYKQKNFYEYKDNSFIKWLLKKGNRLALDYMVLAKEAESTQFKNAPDPWDTLAIKISVQCETIAAKADQLLKTPLPAFLQERYAFQAVKMYYYSDGRSDLQQRLHGLYEKHLLNSKSIVSGWGLVYYGMSQFNSKRRTTFLLQAFDRTEDKKEFAYAQISTKDLIILEKTTRETNLLMLINTLRALKSKGKALTQLKAVYQYNPGSKFLPLLITREINKLENWLWSPEMLLFSENYRPEFEDNENINAAFKANLKAKDRQYLNEVILFLEDVAGKNKTHATFMKLALAHLYNIQRDFTKAVQILQNLGRLPNPIQETQRLIEQVIITSQAKDISKPETQQELAVSIQQLIRLNPVFKKQLDKSTYNIWDNENQNESNDDVSELLIMLSHCFEKKGDRLNAGLVYTSANITVNNYDGWYDDFTGYRGIAWFDRFGSPNDLDKLIAFKHKKNKTLFENMISPKKWALDDEYKDLKGTILFRQKKYKEALAVFESIQAGFWHSDFKYSEYLPSTSVTHTGKLIPSEKSVAPKYPVRSKTAIVKDIVNLQASIQVAKNNTVKAVLCYQLANAYFNTSYNGKAWIMFSYGRSTQEDYPMGDGNYNWACFNFYPNNLKHADYYYRCSDAIEQYKKALSLTTDKELAAKCLLSLAVCDRIKYQHTDNNSNNRWSYNRGVYYSDYLRNLKAGYSNTNAFKEAAVECPDVKSFLSKK